MKKRLFQFAVLWHPTKDEYDSGAKSSVILDLSTILASDEAEAKIFISKQIPDDYDDLLDQLEIIIRPF